MDRMDTLMSQYPTLNFKFVKLFTTHFGALIDNDDVYINENISHNKQYQCLQEEVAHYETTVGDISKQDTIEKRKQERLARSRAYERAIPLDGLIECWLEGLWTTSEIADYFEVDTDYLVSALDHYRSVKPVPFKYKGYWIDLSRGLNISKI